MRVIVRRAPSLHDALKMRSIRNSCRSFMTRDQSEIGVLRQAWWWLTRGLKVRTFLLEEGGRAVGYGIVLVEGDEGWLSGGLLPCARNRGLGTLLFTELCRFTKQEALRPMLEVLKDNPRAEQVYRGLGFVQISETSRAHIMEHRQ